MKKTVIYFAVLLVTSFTFEACKKDKTPEVIAPLECTDTISFSATIEPLINQSCATSGCHNATGSGGYNFSGYTSIFNNREIILKTIRHEDGVTAMPIGAPKLIEAQINAVACWIEQGAPNN
jgi:hypothetical protein